jgi:hypothetical protein
MKQHETLRVIGELKTVGGYEDAFQAQILFEGWLAHFPHVQELYLKNLCDINFEKNRIVVRAKFTDREWTMWCLKHPTPVARRWISS